MTFNDQLQLLLEADEGVVCEIYLCSESVPTFGIGHAIKNDDPEYGQPVGTAVSSERIAEAFSLDIESCLEDCRRLYKNFNDMPEMVKLTLASVAYQIGSPSLSKFRLMNAALSGSQWALAASELRDSRLYRQTTNRTERHAKRLESVA